METNDVAVLRSLMQWFVVFNLGRVRAAGLMPVVWKNLVLTWNLTVGVDVVVQAWNNATSVKDLVMAGHKTLAGTSGYWVSSQYGVRFNRRINLD